jgi:hypothetical protein
VKEAIIMSAWGSGNFENDAAAEQLMAVCGALAGETATLIQDDAAIDPQAWGSDIVLANLEILMSLAQLAQVDSDSFMNEALRPRALPPVGTLEEWKTRYLTIWDANITSVAAVEGFTNERR